MLTVGAGLLPATTWADDDIVLRRDGSKAVQVPAIADPRDPGRPAGDAFDWGAAGVGAGLGGLVVALGAAGVVSLRGRPGA